MVTTVMEDFFRKNLQDKCNMMDNPFYCQKAANGIDIPYTGFISTDLTVGDETITDVGIFMTKTPLDAGMKRRRENIPGLLGMNVLQKCSDTCRVVWTIMFGSRQSQSRDLQRKLLAKL